MKETEISILLIEDNKGDILLTLTALKKAQIHNNVNVVTDGEKALHYLQKTYEYKDAKRPDLILLDINLPRLNGIELLTIIKNDDLLRHIPVVMLTSSKDRKDVEQSYYHYASCFITKPVDFIKFMEMINSFKDFWIKIVKLPNSSEYDEHE